MKDIRKLPYKPAIGLIPEELLGKVCVCPICKSKVQIPWLDKMEFPAQPVAPLKGDGHWVPVSLSLTCQNNLCKNSFSIEIPLKPIEGNWHLYGDEAGRYINQNIHSPKKYPANFFCITLIGLHHSKHDEVRDGINNLKKEISPHRNPSDWIHHFTEIWGSSANDGNFNLKNNNEKKLYAIKFAKLINDSRPELVSLTFSSFITNLDNKQKRKNLIREQKENIFSQAILSSLQQFRNQNKGVSWIFDNIKDTRTGIRTEGWAAQIFLGLQYTPLFTWLSAGSTVLEPKFVQPGSHFLLEVADFYSFCIAREFEKRVNHLESEIPSKLLGEGFYQIQLDSKAAIYKWNLGFPLNEFNI